eukprot:3853253-Pyramimonas_sp.AAC.1
MKPLRKGGKPWDAPRGGYSDAPHLENGRPTIVPPRVAPLIVGPSEKPAKPGIGVGTSPAKGDRERASQGDEAAGGRTAA